MLVHSVPMIVSGAHLSCLDMHEHVYTCLLESMRDLIESPGVLFLWNT